MPPVINPRNERVRADQILARGREFREDGPPPPAPGMPRGYVKMLMEERAARLRPGMPERTRLVWMRCANSPRCGDDDCREAGKCLGTGPMLGCAKCWREHTVADVVIVGPLTAPIGVECRTCGGRDSEVEADTGVPTGYAEAMSRIAEWNATIERRIERRGSCDTPFAWLPLWHPGASWQR